MRKKIVITSIITCIIVVILIVFLWKKTIINMNFLENGKLIFCYDDIYIKESCTEEELAIIFDIFNNKLLYKDNPSCGFSDEISIKINDEQRTEFDKGTLRALKSQLW